jgi:hypothetical protein
MSKRTPPAPLRVSPLGGGRQPQPVLNQGFLS